MNRLYGYVRVSSRDQNTDRQQLAMREYGVAEADIVLQLLSYVAQTEREFIRRLQAEGIAAAKARGVQFGRPPMERPAAYETLCMAWKQGQITDGKAAERLGVTHKTFLKWVSEDVSGEKSRVLSPSEKL